MKTHKKSPKNEAQKISRKAAYTLAAGAAATGAMTAQTEASGLVDESVFYSGTLDINIYQFGALTLDLNYDSFTDILLQNYVFAGGNYQGASVSQYPGQLVGFNSTNTGLAYVSLLTKGDPIDAGSVGPTFFGSMGYPVNPESEFDNVSGGLMGFSFPINGNLHYAWARVSIDNGAGTFVLNEFAYETTPGEGIRAGEVPEPGSLGLLAAGAAGVAAMRKRRRAA